LTVQATVCATQLHTSAHVTRGGHPVVVKSRIVIVSIAAGVGSAMPPSTLHDVQAVSLGGWASYVTSHVSMVHRLHQTVAAVTVTHALLVKGVTVNVRDTGTVTV